MHQHGWTDAKTIIPSEVKSERQNKCDVTYMWNPKKKKKPDTNEFIYKTEIESQTKNTNL